MKIWLYNECISLWYILYTLIKLYLRVTVSSEGFLQILQQQFGTSKLDNSELGKDGGVLHSHCKDR